MAIQPFFLVLGTNAGKVDKSNDTLEYRFCRINADPNERGSKVNCRTSGDKMHQSEIERRFDKKSVVYPDIGSAIRAVEVEAQKSVGRMTPYVMQIEPFPDEAFPD